MRKTQSGYGILIFILLTIVLGATLAANLAGGASVASMMANSNAANMVAAQASLIRGRILQCGIDYPSGNNGTSYRVIYPSATTAANVSALTCPGNSANLWSQSDGVAMPASLSGFNAWQYVNDATSMRITVTSTNADRTAILPRIVTLLGSQASYAGSTLTWVIAQ